MGYVMAGLTGLSLLGMAVPYATGNARKDVITDIVDTGFDTPGQKEINQNWYQRLVSGKSDEELTDLVNDRAVEKVFQNPRYAPQLSLIQSQLGTTWDPSKGTVDTFIIQILITQKLSNKQS